MGEIQEMDRHGGCPNCSAVRGALVEAAISEGRADGPVDSDHGRPRQSLADGLEDAAISSLMEVHKRIRDRF